MVCMEDCAIKLAQDMVFVRFTHGAKVIYKVELLSCSSGTLFINDSSACKPSLMLFLEYLIGLPSLTNNAPTFQLKTLDGRRLIDTSTTKKLYNSIISLSFNVCIVKLP